MILAHSGFHNFVHDNPIIFWAVFLTLYLALTWWIFLPAMAWLYRNRWRQLTFFALLALLEMFSTVANITQGDPMAFATGAGMLMFIALAIYTYFRIKEEGPHDTSHAFEKEHLTQVVRTFIQKRKRGKS